MTLDERLLGARAEPVDVPDEFSQVAALLAAASAPPVAAERAGRDEAVARICAAIAPPTGRPCAGRRSCRRLTITLAAVPSAVALALTAGGVAAATGSLPGPLQSVAASALSHIGISVPRPPGHAQAPVPWNAGRSGTARPAGDDSAAPTGSGTAKGLPSDRGSGTPAARSSSGSAHTKHGAGTANAKASSGGTSNSKASSSGKSNAKESSGGKSNGTAFPSTASPIGSGASSAVGDGRSPGSTPSGKGNQTPESAQ